MKKSENVKQLAVGAVLTALVVILQLLGSFIRFGPFSISLVLVPIVLGAALCNAYIGGWLGFVFGVTVLLSGDAAAFLVVNPIGTVITVLAKGLLCGLAAGLVYSTVKHKNNYLAVFLAAVVCPVVNTGIFLLGCKLFFMQTITEWGLALGFANAAEYMFLGLAGGNFIFELVANILLAPVILRILNIFKKG
ncbi:MAG: ECF transporter S component [Clostridia bacterium]|nr:ECF transporter S component [Clostridia bacterium]